MLVDGFYATMKYLTFFASQLYHSCSFCACYDYRKEVGYDGWRLDFVRGFWGGYVKDYMEATEPYFAVGEYWDSLSYTYGDMDHNQDAHRQRIVDWINATNGTAGAFDVTTKGILHSVRLQLMTLFTFYLFISYSLPLLINYAAFHGIYHRTTCR